jgi:hypothetical protein
MATKYRISESGIQKVVEIIDNGTVVGIRKFFPKEITVSYSGDTIQINDAFTGNTLYEGEAADFVKSDNSVFAESSGDAVLAMTNLANNVSINVTELDGIELVNDAIAPDLSAYAKTTDLDSLETSITSSISSSVATAKSEIQEDIDRIDANIIAVQSAAAVLQSSVDTLEANTSTIGQILFSGAAVNYNFTTEETVKCKSTSAITFTTGSNPNVKVAFNGTWQAYGLAQVMCYLSPTSPEDVPNGSTNFTRYVEDAPILGDGSMPKWLDDNVVPGQNDQIALSNFLNTGSNGNGELATDNVTLNLEENTSYTFYIWAFTSVFGVSATNNITISSITVTESISAVS